MVTDMIISRLSERGWRCFAIIITQSSLRLDYYQHVILYSSDTTEAISRIVEFCNVHQIEILINTEGAFPRFLGLFEALKRRSGIKIVSWFHQTPLIVANITTFHRRVPIPRKLNHWLYAFYKSIWFRPKYNKGIRTLYRLSDRYVVLDEAYKAQFAKYNHIADTSKISVIHNPAIRRANIDYEAKRDIALYVGRMSEEKRLDRILALWESFYQSHSGWELWLIGSGPLQATTIQKARKLRLGGVRFMGHCREIEAFYRQAKLLLLVSDYEGWPMALVEAMSFGVVPVAYESFSAVRTIISHGESGYVVVRSSREEVIRQDLKDNMERAITDYGTTAVKASKIADRFDIDVIVDQWERLLSALISPSPHKMKRDDES